MRKTFKSNDIADWFYSSRVTTNEGTIGLRHHEERKVLLLLQTLEEICAELVKSKEIIYQFKNGELLICNDLGEKLLNIMQNRIIHDIDWILPGCRLNPMVRIALNAITMEKVFESGLKLSLYKSMGKIELVVEKINAVVDAIRKEGSSDEFKRVLKNYKRCANKNRKEVSNLVEGVFCRYSKVLVVRVDLAYKRASGDLGLPHDVNHTDARCDLQTLLKDMRSKLFKTNYITYAWKLEYGPIKGYHYHVFFFFDGSKVRRDIDIANMIGNHWSTVVTAGRGCFFNCNAVKMQYPSPGIGMIEYTDSKKIDNLKNKALEYLMKSDYYVKAIADDGIRTFGKGKIPEPPAKNKGRPRGSIKFGLRSPVCDLM